MFHSKRLPDSPLNLINPAVAMMIESLEDRRLLSASFHRAGHHHGGDLNQSVNTVEFNQTPAAVQHGLDTLAIADGLAAPAADSTDTVLLGNSRGVETFTLDITSTGTDTKLTVDQNGTPVTAPVKSTTDWATLNGSAAGSDAAAAAEISAIATALGLTAPTDATVVNVVTTNGASTYSVRLSNSTNTWHHSTVIAVDAAGNPVGNQNLPFSVLPAAIQDGLNTNRPAGADALDPASTQTVKVRTLDGATRYSTTFTSSGTQTTVTVDSSGTLAKVPSTTTDQFQNIPTAAQTELQALATANGVTDAIGPTQTVKVYDEANGITVYAVTLSATKTDSGGSSQTIMVTVASDQNGNPTTPPNEGFGGRGGGGCHGGFDDSTDSLDTGAAATASTASLDLGASAWFGRFGFSRFLRR